MNHSQPDAESAPQLLVDALVHLELVDNDDTHWHYLGRVLWVTPRGIGLRLPRQAVLPGTLKADGSAHISRVTVSGLQVTTLVTVAADDPCILAIGIEDPADHPNAVPKRPWYENATQRPKTKPTSGAAGHAAPANSAITVAGVVAPKPSPPC